MACLNPYRVLDSNGDRTIPVPCGKCSQCKKKRVDDWTFRLLKEEEVSTSSLFVNITYDNFNIPLTPKGKPTLDKKAIPLFMKRLRKLTPKGVRLKYYYCGEYGTNTKRPHYHMILFNSNADNVQKAWMKDGKSMGNIVFGKVTPQSCKYVLKYIQKQQNIGIYDYDDREREFSSMSKGIGEAYLTPAVIKWHKNNNALYVVNKGGRKQSMPRYYRSKIFTEHELSELLAQAAIKGEEQIRQQQLILIKLHGVNWEFIKRQIIINDKHKMYAKAKATRCTI